VRELLEVVLLVVVLLLTVFVVAPRILATEVPLAVVSSWSMEPTLHVGDLIVVSRAREPRVGDVVVYVNPSGELIVHRLVGVIETQWGVEYVTRGDYCFSAHSVGCAKDQYSPFPSERVKGRVELVIPYLGTIRLIVERALRLLRWRI